MKLVTWNVNGVRAIMRKNFTEFFNKVDADVICLQETKIHDDDVPEDLKNFGALQGYKSYWYGAKKKGYSSVATITRFEPLDIIYGIGDSRFDDEGRHLTLEFEKFYLINTYVPNAKGDLSRLDERQDFDNLTLNFMKKLEKKKPVIICGDMNVAHKEIDLKYPKANEGEHGFTKEERQGMTNYIEAGFIDVFRKFDESPNNYTWWSYRGNARANNSGWRIDYFLASKKLGSKISDCEILSKVMGSDHCPVLMEIVD